jgi:hypothetical protein
LGICRSFVPDGGRPNLLGVDDRFCVSGLGPWCCGGFGVEFYLIIGTSTWCLDDVRFDTLFHVMKMDPRSF